ncbi:MAG: dihydrodipicolinate synthase family protein [Clostridiales bacterium]|nr:dihydrodipicolinate synthase family protein [Clostridiales bacterium]
MFSGNPEEYRGIYSLLLTPFNEDKTIDYDTYAKYVEFQVEKGSHHLFAVCGSSEMTLLTPDERVKCATIAAKHSGDVEVVATANLEPGWHMQVEEIKRMEQTGVDGLVFVTKGYADNDDRLVAYISELAEQTTLPIMLYEFPGMQPHLMSGKAYGRLVETGRIIAIKDTTSTLPGIKDKIPYQGDTAILQANMPYLFDAYVAGARGVCATPTSCGVRLFRKMYDEFFIEKDIEKARLTHQDIIALDNAIDSGFNASAKYLLKLQGLPFTTVTRTGASIGPARMRSLEVYYDSAKDKLL